MISNGFCAQGYKGEKDKLGKCEQVLADKLHEVLDFSKDLSSLEPAAKVKNLVGNFHKFYNIIESKMPFSSLRFGQFCDFRPKVCFFVSGSKRFKIMPFSSGSLSPSIFLR
ncbi:hypothetical protein Hanom_Chr01g00012291 [Helianthus anomalus]